MTKLGVNIDHSATLRQARYRDCLDNPQIIIEPDIAEMARLAESAGADSITAHLREDRRHMTDADLRALRKCISTKLNMEMACNPDVLSVALEIVPDYACLVPENRLEVTTEGGLDVLSNTKKTADTVAALSAKGIVVSIFIDPDTAQIAAAKDIGAPVVELHTGAYANAWGDLKKRAAELERLKRAADFAREIGMTVNSGHGINYQNVVPLLRETSFNELNIGHSIICRALAVGLPQAVSEMKALIDAR